MVDGRKARAVASRRIILSTTRELMKAGIFRPTMVQVAQQSGICIRTAFAHFGSHEELLAAAVLDGLTQDHIVNFVCAETGGPANLRDRYNIARAAVFGHLFGREEAAIDARAVGASSTVENQQ